MMFAYYCTVLLFWWAVVQFFYSTNNRTCSTKIRTISCLDKSIHYIGIVGLYVEKAYTVVLYFIYCLLS